MNLSKEWVLKAYHEMTPFTRGIISGSILGFGAVTAIYWNSFDNGLKSSLAYQHGKDSMKEIFHKELQTKNDYQTLRILRGDVSSEEAKKRLSNPAASVLFFDEQYTCRIFENNVECVPEKTFKDFEIHYIKMRDKK